MDLLNKLSQYIAIHAYDESRRQPSMAGQEPCPFLTISREAGAGGHSLANALLEEMARYNDPLLAGWKVFDATFCAQILEDAKLMASLESLQKEETRTPWEDAVYELVGGRASSDRVDRKIFQAMKLLAQLGKLIIIGRGGACVTANLALGIHVRLVAPISLRIERMKERAQIPGVDAERMVREFDAERAKFVRAHFGMDITDPGLYHATWNTGRIAFEELAKILVEMIKARALSSLQANHPRAA